MICWVSISAQGQQKKKKRYWWIPPSDRCLEQRCGELSGRLKTVSNTLPSTQESPKEDELGTQGHLFQWKAWSFQTALSVRGSASPRGYWYGDLPCCRRLCMSSCKDLNALSTVSLAQGIPHSESLSKALWHSVRSCCPAQQNALIEVCCKSKCSSVARSYLTKLAVVYFFLTLTLSPPGTPIQP